MNIDDLTRQIGDYVADMLKDTRASKILPEKQSDSYKIQYLDSLFKLRFEKKEKSRDPSFYLEFNCPDSKISNLKSFVEYELTGILEYGLRQDKIFSRNGKLNYFMKKARKYRSRTVRNIEFNESKDLCILTLDFKPLSSGQLRSEDVLIRTAVDYAIRPFLLFARNLKNKKK